MCMCVRARKVVLFEKQITTTNREVLNTVVVVVVSKLQYIVATTKYEYWSQSKVRERESRVH